MALPMEVTRARNAARMRAARERDPSIRERDRASALRSAALHPERARENFARYDQRRRDDPEIWARHMVCSLRGRCKRKGLPFDLTAPDLAQLIPADRICPAIGIPIIFGGKLSRNSPSIDRLTPSLGYVRGNIAIISHKANSMKQDCVDPAEVRRLADWMEGLSAQPHADDSRRAA